MKKRVLVTGGAGFIGSHICEDLVKKGHDVICLDNYFTGGKENINHLRDFKNFELIRHDVTEEIRLEVDQIYNFACPASPIHYQNNPIKTIKTNVLGILNMLGLAKRVRARILQASTSEIYGNPLEHPQKKSIGVTSILLVLEVVMMKGKDFPKLYVLITIDTIVWTSK